MGVSWKVTCSNYMNSPMHVDIRNNRCSRLLASVFVLAALEVLLIWGKSWWAASNFVIPRFVLGVFFWVLCTSRHTRQWGRESSKRGTPRLLWNTAWKWVCWKRSGLSETSRETHLTILGTKPSPSSVGMSSTSVKKLGTDTIIPTMNCNDIANFNVLPVQCWKGVA